MTPPATDGENPERAKPGVRRNRRKRWLLRWNIHKKCDPPESGSRPLPRRSAVHTEPERRTDRRRRIFRRRCIRSGRSGVRSRQTNGSGADRLPHTLRRARICFSGSRVPARGGHSPDCDTRRMPEDTLSERESSGFPVRHARRSVSIRP